MSHFDESIAALQEQLRKTEQVAADQKRAINALCRAAGRDPIYEETVTTTGIDAIRSDTFYGQPLNSSARRVLEMRKAAGLGAATIREIYDSLIAGGFDFKAKNDKNAMDGLRISLGKASHTFHKLPNGEYGLADWYPNVKKKGRGGSSSDEVDEGLPERDEDGNAVIVGKK